MKPHRSPAPARASAAVGVTITALLLAGCSFPAFAEPPIPAITGEQIEVPESMMPTEDDISVGAILPADDGLPWAFGGSRASVGEAADPTVWTSLDGDDWTETVVDTVDGSFSGLLAGNSEITALAGEVWKDGHYSPRLWTSDDRVEWTPVDLPEGFAASGRIDIATVTSSRLNIVSTDNEGIATALTIAGGDARPLELPEVDGETLLRVNGLTASGETLLLTAAPGKRGTSTATVSYLSDDSGATWTRGGEIGEAASWISDVTPVSRGYVATGSTTNSEGIRRASAWFSTDGSVWHEETLPGDAEDWYPASANTWLGAPSASDNVVVAMLGADNELRTAVVQRGADGTWSHVARTAPNAANGVGGFAALRDDRIVGLTVGYGEIQVGYVEHGAWQQSMTVGNREEVFRITDLQAKGTSATLTMQRANFRYSPTGSWRSSSEVSGGTLNDGQVTLVDMEPRELQTLNSVEHLRTSEGELALGTEFTKMDTIVVRGFFRAEEGDEWAPVTGFPTTGVLGVDALHHLDGRWTAVMQRRDSAAVGTPEHTEVWSSDNGVAWTKSTDAANDAGDTDGRSSSYVASCPLPDGSLLLAGHTRDAADRYFPSLWKLDDEWHQIDIGDAASEEGYATSCASQDDGVVLSVTTGGRKTLMYSDDGAEWMPVFEAEPWMVFREPVAVDGGYAAAGVWRGDAHELGAVWLSSDGKTWVPVSIGSPRPFGITRIDAVGSDLLVSRPASSGSPALLIRDIAEVIQQHASGARE